MSERPHMAKEELLFGQPRYEVESLADTIQRAVESEITKPDVYAAAMKLVERRKKVLIAITAAAGKKKE
jgi:hypothetical protein